MMNAEEIVKALRTYAGNAQKNNEFDTMRDFDAAADLIESLQAQLAENAELLDSAINAQETSQRALNHRAQPDNEPLRERCPIMDVSLYSKIENGHCLPNAETLAALEEVLQAPRTQLLEADELAAPPDDESQEKALRVNPYVAMLATAIPYGRRNAITRQALAAKLGMNDRTARKAIEEARAAGLLIMCEQNGRGYYQSDDPVEMRCQYQQDTNRAMSILKRRKPLRDALLAAGQRV